MKVQEEDEFAKTVLSFTLMKKIRMTLRTIRTHDPLISQKRAGPLNQHDNFTLIERYT